MSEKIVKSGLRIKADKAKKGRCLDLIVVIENPTDIRNIATAIRNVDALGAEKIYVISESEVLLKDWKTEMRNNNNLNKVSVSAIRYTFVKNFTSTDECIKHLQKKGFISKATSPHLKGKKNTLLQDVDFTEKRIAIWFGNETHGLTDEAIENSNECIQIYMSGIIESLNLGTSTGIVLYEATKQRRAFTEKILQKKKENRANKISK